MSAAICGLSSAFRLCRSQLEFEVPLPAATTLIAALPRSGSTLLCTLLSQQPDTLALAEPMRTQRFASPDLAWAAVDRLIPVVRKQILTEKVAPMRARAGKATDNFMNAPKAGGGPRPNEARLQLVKVEQPLSPDFHLYLKHPTLFTALIPTAAGKAHPIIGLVRAPLAVVASWETVMLSVRDGRATAAEMLHPGLKTYLDDAPSRYGRQARLMEWFLQRLAQLPRAAIIRYEDLVVDPSTTLAQVHPGAAVAMKPLKQSTINDRYPGIDLRPAAKRLRRIAPEIEVFYPGYARVIEAALDGVEIDTMAQAA